MSTAIDVYGLGHALVDVVVPVEKRFFEDLRFPVGQRLAISAEQQNKLLAAARIDESRAETSLGGSVAQTLSVISRLDGKTAFCGRVANDELAGVLRRALGSARIYFNSSPIQTGSTGRALVLSGPGGMRSTATHLGVSKDFNPTDISPAMLRQVKWVLIEGFLLENGRLSQDAVMGVVNYVKNLAPIERPKIGICLGSRYLVRDCKDVLVKALADCDLVFGRLREVMILTDAATPSEALERLGRLVPNFVVTAGKEGAYFAYGKKYGHVPAVDVGVCDSTGAGEVFLGAFLYGITNEYPAEKTVRCASYLAAQYIKRREAGLDCNLPELWQEALRVQ